MRAWNLQRDAIAKQIKWGALFALVLAIASASGDLAFMDSNRQPGARLWSLAAQITLFLYWAVVAPGVLYLMDWTRRCGCSRAKGLALHLGLYAVLGSAFYAFLALVNVVLFPLG